MVDAYLQIIHGRLYASSVTSPKGRRRRDSDSASKKLGGAGNVVVKLSFRDVSIDLMGI